MLLIALGNNLPGLGVLVVGVAVLLWSWHWDRAKGRRRCSRCWYDMSRSPGLTCSECGHTARREAHCYRTRRSRFGLACGVALLGASYLLIRWPTVRANGWRTILPTSAIVFLGRWYAGTSTAVGEEIERRYVDDEYWDWQLAWLLRWAWTDENPPVRVVVEARDEWAIDETLVARLDVRRRWLRDLPWNVVIESDKQGDLGPYRLVEGAPATQVRFGYDVWDDRTFPLAEGLAPGEQDLNCTIEVLRADWAGAAWVPVHRTRHVHRITGVEDAPDIMRPVRSAGLDETLRQSLSVYIDPTRVHGIDPQFATPEENRPQEAFADTTLAVQMEIMRDDTVVSSTTYWWKRGLVESAPYRGWLPFDESDTSELDAIRAADDLSAWSVRIRSHPPYALRDHESAQYWDGEVVVPLHRSK